jgi:hypothetical protein
VIAGVLESKAPEVYTSAVLDSLAHRYYSDVAAFESERMTKHA